MAICPATLKPCIGDLCYGGGCLRLGGEEMLVPCNGCGKLVGMHGGNDDDCECDTDDYLDDFRRDDEE